MGKVHGEKMRPPLDAGDDRIRLAKVRLSVTRRVRQRHEHLTLATAPFPDVILDDGLFARKAMLVAKTLGISASPCGAACSEPFGPLPEYGQ